MIAVLTILISFAAFVVAGFSLVINEEKFRLDLYNKRFDIYVKTVRFHQLLLLSSRDDQDEEFRVTRKDFIIASRESQFLFSPESGVYDLLLRLNMASFVITGQKDMPKSLPVDQIKANQEKFSAALMLWTNLEPLEALMSPYLNYHYASAGEAVIGRLQQSWVRFVSKIRSLVRG